MNYPRLLKAIDAASRQWQARAVTFVNQALVLRNWLIGAYLVEFEQHGEDRAKYGVRLLARLAGDLKKRGLAGLSVQMLERTRQFYLVYPQLGSEFSSPAVRELGIAPPSGGSMKSSPLVRISAPASGGVTLSPVATEPNLLAAFGPVEDSATTSGEIGRPLVGESAGVPPLSVEAVLRLSWTQILELIRIDDPLKRAFYENECLKGNWSKRQLQRQIGSLLYERTALPSAEQLRAFLEKDRDRLEALLPQPRQQTRRPRRNQ